MTLILSIGVLLYYLGHAFIILFIAIVLSILLDYFFEIGAPAHIGGLYVIKGYPIVGNLFQVLNNLAKVYMDWAITSGYDIFQIRLGIKRVVVVNSFDDCRSLCIRHSCATNSRPILYIFHEVVSSTQGFTVGSSPAGESYKRKKKAVSMGLNKRRVDSFSQLMNEETSFTIREIIRGNLELYCMPSCICPRCHLTKLSDINLMPHVQFLVLKVAIRISYGITLDSYGRDRVFFEHIINTENEIINLRSPAANIEDFIPILRFLPFGKARRAARSRSERDKYMGSLMSTLRNKLDSGDQSAANSIIGKICSENKILSPDEIQSICLTMISAGLDKCWT